MVLVSRLLDSLSNSTTVLPTAYILIVPFRCSPLHKETEEEAKPKLEDLDRYPDDNNDVQFVSESSIRPSLCSTLLIKDIQAARSKAIQYNTNQLADTRQGSFGIRLLNSNSARKTIVVWLYEAPLTKPHQLGIIYKCNITGYYLLCRGM